jgi:poly-gamma-glutamate synthesis protein (capsule biosynthesis protein)
MKKLALVLLLLLSGCSGTAKIDPKPYTGPTDTIAQDLVLWPMSTSMDMIMVGDAIVHSSVYADAKLANGTYDFTDMIARYKPIIEPYDLAFYNQETILGGSALGVSNYPRFNSPQEFGDAMLDAGFNLVSLANNHSNDTGTKALLSSNAYWKTKNAIVAGTYSTREESEAVKVYTQNGISFGFLAYTYGLNGLNLSSENAFMVDLIDLDKMKVDVEALRPLVDVLIVSVHFGSEYQNTPNTYQKNVVNKLAEWGVDIVIGNHAHAIQPIQWVGKTLVYYALGNFISGQIGTEKLIGLTSAIKITKVIYGSETWIELSDLRADLTYNYYDSRMRNISIYPWDEVTTQLLPDKAAWESKYLKIVNALGANLSFGGLRK